MKRAVAGLLLALFAGAAAAQIVQAETPPVDLPPAQQERYEGFTHRLRCLVCQNQTIADSSAPLAADLRDQVRAQIVAGRSDEEITHYLTDRYGDFVLYQPQFKASTALLWLGPGLLLLAGLIAALIYLRKPKKAVAPAAADEAALKRLLDDNP